MSNTFKQTDIGLIPADWEVLNISEVSKFSRGTSWRKSEESPDGILVISIPNIKDGSIDFDSKFNHYIKKRITENKKLEVGDIIFVGSSGSLHNVGRNALINHLPFEPIAFASFTFKAKVNNKKIDTKFFYHLVNSPVVKLQKFTKRAADGKFNFQLQEFQRTAKIPYMCLSEQKNIAHVLSKIQQAIETQEQIIKTTQEFKKALTQKLFTEGLNGEPQKQTEIGPIPESWEVKEFAEIADDFIGGGTPSTSKEDYWNGDIHWTTSKRLGDSLYLDNGEKLITKKGLEESATHLIPKNNLLIGSRVGVGKVAILNIDMAISQDLTGVFINNSKYSLEFLSYQLLSDRVQQVFSKQQRGTTIKGITRDDLKYQIKLGVPKDFKIQKQVARPLINLDSKINLSSSRLESLKSLFSSSLNQLMTGQIRVKDMEFKIEENINTQNKGN